MAKAKIISERKFTVKGAAERSGMSESWWRRAILEKRVAVLRIGRRIFIQESTIANLYKSTEAEN